MAFGSVHPNWLGGTCCQILAYCLLHHESTRIANTQIKGKSIYDLHAKPSTVMNEDVVSVASEISCRDVPHVVESVMRCEHPGVCGAEGHVGAVPKARTYAPRARCEHEWAHLIPFSRRAWSLAWWRAPYRHERWRKWLPALVRQRSDVTPRGQL